VPNKTVFITSAPVSRRRRRFRLNFNFFLSGEKTQRRKGCFINGSFHQLRSARTLKACFIYMSDFAGRRNLVGTLSEGEGSLQLALPIE
jgi:hypothetical protein